MLSDRYTVLDKFANRRVLIGNVIGLKQVNGDGGMPKLDPQGNPIMVPLLKRPMFDKGALQVTSEYNDSYAFLMRAPTNLSNKFRPRNVTARFELISEKKDQSDALMIDDMRFRAIDIVRHGNWDDLRAVREKLNKSPDVTLHVSTIDLQGIKIELSRLALNRAKAIILASDDLPSKHAVQVYDALAYNILMYEEPTWILNVLNTKGVMEAKTIHTVPPDEDKVESLVASFQGEGSANQVLMATELKKILKATAA
jgi:rRNA maturation endonuclease Nob1